MTRSQPPWPGSWWRFDPSVKYSDLTSTMWAARRPKPYDPVFAHVRPPYFPFLLGVLRLGPVGWMRVVYMALVTSLTCLLGWPALLVGVVSYPAWFADDRGNLDHIINAWTALSVCMLWAGFPVLAGCMLGMAVACKGYPAAWGLLWLGHWWGLVAIAVSALMCTLWTMYILGMRETWAGWRQGMKDFGRAVGPCDFGPDYSNAHYCSDPLNALRLLHWWRGKAFPYERWARPYLACATVWALALTGLAWTTPHMYVACLALSLIQCIWPGVCSDYKLTVLGLGFVLAIPLAPWYVLACLVCLWLPKHVWFPRYPFSKGSLSCIINPVVLIALTAALFVVG